MPERRAGKEARNKKGKGSAWEGGMGWVGSGGRWSGEVRGVDAVIIQASRTLTKFDVRERL